MNKYIKILMFCALTILCQRVWAQQVPLINGYYNVPSLTYPSYSAFEVNPKLTFVYRGQWTGLNGSPETVNINYSGQLNKAYSLNLNLSSFETGLLKQNVFTAGVARVISTGNNRFSFGAQLGGSRFSLDESKLSVDNINDVLINELLGNDGFDLWVAMSLSYKSKYFTANLAVPKLTRMSVSDDGFSDINSDNNADYLMNLSYELRLCEFCDVFIRPQVTWRYQKVLGNSFDLMSQVDFNNKLQVMFGIREDFGGMAGIGIRVRPNLLFTYNHDFGKKDVAFISDGFNEIGLQMSLKSKREKMAQNGIKANDLIEKLRKEEIYNVELISKQDQEDIINYLASLEKGRRKNRQARAEMAFQDILIEIKNTGDAKRTIIASNQLEKATLVPEVELIASDQSLLYELNDVVVQKSNPTEFALPCKRGTEIVGDYILVVNSYFKRSPWITGFWESLKGEFPEVSRYLSDDFDYDYVYLLSYESWDEALQDLRRLKDQGRFLDSWILKIKREPVETSVPEVMNKETIPQERGSGQNRQ